MTACFYCGAKRTSSIHSSRNRDFHAYQDARDPGLHGMSDGMRAYRRASGYDAAKEAALGTPCQILSPVCTGRTEALHEPLSRGRAGGLEAAVELGGTIPACNACNGYVSGEGQVWARERGFLFSATVPGIAAAQEAKEQRETPPVKRSKSRM